MARGSDDPADGDEGRVLSPDELDITDDEHVAEIDEGRYVVSPNDPIEDVPAGTGTATDDRAGSRRSGDAADGRGGQHGPDRPTPDDGRGGQHGPDRPTPDDGTGTPGDQRPRAAESPAVTEADVHEWLESHFEDTDSRYGFDVTAKFDGSVHQRRMVSNDVVTIFESLVLWYAQGIDSTTPVEEVLGILLMEANVPVRYPPGSLRRVLESTDLSPDDTIADLMAAVGDEDGFRL